MDKLSLVLLAFAFVLFCITAYQNDMPAKLGWAGLAFFAAAILFGNLPLLFKA